MRGGGESPIDVTGIVELTSIKGADVNTIASGHGEVGKRSDTTDECGEDVVLLLAIGLTVGRISKEESRSGHAEEASPDDFLALFGEVFDVRVDVNLSFFLRWCQFHGVVRDLMRGSGVPIAIIQSPLPVFCILRRVKLVCGLGTASSSPGILRQVELFSGCGEAENEEGEAKHGGLHHSLRGKDRGGALL
jgi:hypothetical protein